MPKKAFSHSDDERLVDAIRGHPLLHRPETRGFRTVESKTQAWDKVAEVVGKDVDTCKKRWRDVRDNYHRIFRRGGASSSRWPLFERLHNMMGNLPYAHRRPYVSPMTIDDDSAVDDAALLAGNCLEIVHKSDHSVSPLSAVVESDNSSQRSTHEQRRKRTKRHGRKNNNCDYNDDDVDLFMKSVALSVKKLPNSLISKAKMDILLAVSRLEAQMCNNENKGLKEEN